uniref:EF-hand domain-containing protein n=1 Tax=Oryza punctata TaxID=4537 RepID=A0A0E0JTL7_ORYPU
MVKIKMPALFRRRSGSKSPPLPHQPQADPSSGGGSPAPTPEEEMERVFRKFDANGDGRISRSELGALFESLGHAATDDELARMMAEADADGDGFISLDEFAALNATASGDAAAVEEDLRHAFRVFDADGNGTISAAELARVLHGLGEKATVQQCRRMIEGVDQNGDGLISFEEFKVMMAGGGSFAKIASMCILEHALASDQERTLFFFSRVTLGVYYFATEEWVLAGLACSWGETMSGGGGGGGLVAGLPYQKFVSFALEETRLRTTLTPHPSQEKFKSIKPNDDNTVFNALSFSAPKIRLLRSLTIEKKNSFQVLDFAAFSEPEYDLPIFCANVFTTPAQSIVVLDLNPLYDTTVHKDYKDKYYRSIMPLVHKYNKLLPWGGKITSESLKFFSPIVIWTIFESTEHNHHVLHSAFMDYYKARPDYFFKFSQKVWLELMGQAIKENNKATIARNQEEQHKYLTWRAEKDPGYPLLKKLIGESRAEDLVMEFLFEGVNTLGTKSFLDYFPDYARDDGSVNKKRSMIGKSFETRPWDANGEFIGDAEAQ